MNRLMKIEMKKLGKSLAFKIILGIIVLTCFMNVGIFALVKVIDDPAMNMSLAVMGMMGDGLKGYNVFVSYTGAMDDVLLFTVILMCILICGDFSSRTLQGQISAGYSRTNVAISRLFTTVIVFAVLSAVYLMLNMIGMSMIFGFGKDISFDIIVELIVRFIFCMVANVAMLSIYWLIIFMVKSVGASIGVCLPFSIFLTPIIRLIETFFEGAGKIIDWTPFGITSIPAMTSFETGDVIRLFVTSIVTVGLIITANIALFRRSELK